MSTKHEFERDLDNAKSGNLAHALVRAARLVNEVGLTNVRANDQYAQIRPSHLALMPHLDLDGTRSTELARRMGISKQAVGQLVAEIEALGLVVRVPDPTDGRARLVKFTEAGRGALLDGLAVLGDIDAALRAKLGATRVERLVEDLAELERAVLELSASTPQSP